MGKGATRRFSVYRNNVIDSLIKALQTGFPVISQLLGEQNFKNIASLFVRQHPPENPVINQYGDLFPTFLEGFEPLEHLPYLADTARLELALRRSYHAADSAFVHPSEFEALSPEALNLAQLRIAPHAFLIRSCWPIYSVWQYNTTPNAPNHRRRRRRRMYWWFGPTLTRTRFYYRQAVPLYSKVYSRG